MEAPKTFLVEFSEADANSLMSLLDVAVKTGGLSVANNALVIASRVQSAYNEFVKPVEKK